MRGRPSDRRAARVASAGWVAVKTKLLNLVADGIVWFAVLATASGAGLLLSEIFDH